MSGLANSSNYPRVVVIGSTAVGKTTLIGRIVENQFNDNTQPTTGTTFYVYQTGNPQKPAIQIWDTAGMERFRSINKNFYRDAIAALICFDLTSYDSFKALDSWHKEFITEAAPNPILILVGTKNDLSDDFQIEDEEIENYASKNGFKYFSTSSKTGDGVQPMLDCLIQMLPEFDDNVTTNVIVQDEEKKSCC